MNPVEPAKTDDTAGRAPAAATSYAFDGYVLAPARNGLFRGDEQIALSAKSLDLLLTLVRAAGTVVPRERLLQAAWPGGDIDDANLRVQLSMLRKILAAHGDSRRHIDSVPGKGYCFVAQVCAAAATPSFDPPRDLFGRAAAIDEISELLHARGQVSLVGAGGVGKSALARAVAARLAATGAAPVILFDLAEAPAAAEQETHAPAQEIGAEPCLFLLENCEYDDSRTARLLQRLAQRRPGVPVLAVSRATLQLSRQTVYRLAPLPLPPRGAGMSLAEASHYAAVQLFCVRARSACPALQIGDRHVPDLIELCHALDGLPLALELAARHAMVCDFGKLLAQGAAAPPPAAPGQPRAHSMWHTLDWSFDRLSAREQMALCRLSVFRDSFGLISVSSALVGCGLPEALVLPTLQALVARSLVMAERQGDFTLYRLLNSTRAYALERYVERKQLCQSPCSTDIRHLPPPVLSLPALAP